VESHPTPIWLGQRFTGNHLQEEHQFQSITEVLFNVLNLCTDLRQVRVAPGGKRLNNNTTEGFAVIQLNVYYAGKFP